MNIQIRDAEKNDVNKIASLLAAYYSEGGIPLDKESIYNSIDEKINLCKKSDTHTMLLAIIDNSIIGYCTVSWVSMVFKMAIEGYIPELLVDKSFRGEGAGSALIHEVESRARKLGAFRIMLNCYEHTQCFKTDFYQKLGFIRRSNVSNFVKEFKP